MLSHRLPLIALTALAPVLWGTTYFTSASFLVADHPLLTATIRALPAGLVLLLLGRRLPSGAWWWKAAVLGVLNVGAFFAFLFIAADRLPGGVAAVIGGIQPLLVAVLAARILAERIAAITLVAGASGAAGVALIVLRADARLDVVGVGAALAGAACMAVGVVLAKRWGSTHPPLVTTSWQLLVGGLLLAVLTAVLEPLPTSRPTLTNVAGYAYLTLVGTALAYLLWFRGVRALPASVPAFLGLLSPVVAVTIGVSWAGETLSWSQITGMVLVLLSVAAALAARTTRRGANIETPALPLGPVQGGESARPPYPGGVRLPTTPATTLMRELRDEVRQHLHGGRLILAVDGVDPAATASFADGLAGAFSEEGTTVFRSSMPAFQRPRAERLVRGVHSPDGYYRDTFDVATFRRVLVDPFRTGEGTGFQLASWHVRRDAPASAQWSSGPRDAVLIVDGPFLHRPELRGIWNWSLRLQGEAAPDERASEAEALYRRDGDARRLASALVDVSDPAHPARVFGDFC